MKNLILITLLCLTMLFAGCSTVAPNSTALPRGATKDQIAAAALADTKRALSDSTVQAGAEITLSTAKIIAVSQVKPPEAQAEINNQLIQWGSTLKALVATGQPITPDQLSGIFRTFNSNADAKLYSIQFGSLTNPVNNYINSLSKINDIALTRQWAIIFANACLAGTAQ